VVSENSSAESVAEALTKSKPKSLTNLELRELKGSFIPLASVLLDCPSLTTLSISTSDQDVLSVIQMLHRLPLAKLTLDLSKFSDESLECLLSFLSRSAVQDLRLGTLSPEQLQLVVDALPSLSCLQSLEFDTFGFRLCQHDSSHLALFSALARTSLRYLAVRFGSFRRSVLETCLDKISETQLTRVLLETVVYAEDFDATIHDETYKKVDYRKLLDWNIRFPQIKDRFCLIVK
jgi:hypothetical protein